MIDTAAVLMTALAPVSMATIYSLSDPIGKDKMDVSTICCGHEAQHCRNRASVFRARQALHVPSRCGTPPAQSRLPAGGRPWPNAPTATEQDFMAMTLGLVCSQQSKDVVEATSGCEPSSWTGHSWKRKTASGQGKRWIGIRQFARIGAPVLLQIGCAQSAGLPPYRTAGRSLHGRAQSPVIGSRVSGMRVRSDPHHHVHGAGRACGIPAGSGRIHCAG